AGLETIGNLDIGLIRSVRFTTLDQYLLICGERGFVSYDVNRKAILRREKTKNPVIAGDMDSSSESVAFVTEDGVISLFDPNAGEQARTFELATASPDRAILVGKREMNELAVEAPL